VRALYLAAAVIAVSACKKTSEAKLKSDDDDAVTTEQQPETAPASSCAATANDTAAALKDRLDQQPAAVTDAVANLSDAEFAELIAKDPGTDPKADALNLAFTVADLTEVTPDCAQPTTTTPTELRLSDNLLRAGASLTVSVKEEMSRRVAAGADQNDSTLGAKLAILRKHNAYYWTKDKPGLASHARTNVKRKLDVGNYKGWLDCEKMKEPGWYCSIEFNNGGTRWSVTSFRKDGEKFPGVSTDEINALWPNQLTVFAR
jgi:hypothetical protein